MYTPKFFSKVISSVASAGDRFYAVPCSRLGILNSVVIKQTSGTLAGYEWELYCSEDGAQGNGDLAAEHYSITGVQTVGNSTAAGAIREKHFSFQNVDADPGYTPSGKEELWIRIKPSGTGSKDFSVSLVVEMGSSV